MKTRSALIGLLAYSLLIPHLWAQPYQAQRRGMVPPTPFAARYEKTLRVRITDGITGKPVAGASATMQFDEPMMVGYKGMPQLSDAQGIATVQLISPAPFNTPFRVRVRSAELINFISEPCAAECNEVSVTLPKERVWAVARFVDQAGGPAPRESCEIWWKAPGQGDTMVGQATIKSGGLCVYGPLVPGEYYARFTLHSEINIDKPVQSPLMTIKDPVQAATLVATKLALPPRLNLRFVDTGGNPIKKVELKISINSAEGEQFMSMSPFPDDQLESGTLPLYTTLEGRYRIRAENEEYTGQVEPNITGLANNPIRDILIVCHKVAAGSGSGTSTGGVEPQAARQNERFPKPTPSIASTGGAALQQAGGEARATGKAGNPAPPPPPGITISGRITDPDGRPVKGATVQFGHGIFPAFKTDERGEWKQTVPPAKAAADTTSGIYIDYSHPDYVPVQVVEPINFAHPPALVMTLFPPVEVAVQFVPALKMSREPEALLRANPERLCFELTATSASLGRRLTFGMANDQFMTRGFGTRFFASRRPAAASREPLNPPRKYANQANLFKTTYFQPTLLPGTPILHQRILPRGVPLYFDIGEMGQIVGQPVWLLNGREITTGTWALPYDLKGRLTLRLPVVMHPPDVQARFPVNLRVVNAMSGKPMENVWLCLNATGDNQSQHTLPDGSAQFTYYPDESRIYVGGREATMIETSRGRIENNELAFDADPQSSPQEPVILKAVPTPQDKSIRIEVVDVNGDPIGKPLFALDRTLRWPLDPSRPEAMVVHNTGEPTAELLLSFDGSTIEPVEVVSATLDEGETSDPAAKSVVSAAADTHGYPALRVQFGGLKAHSTIYCTVRLPEVGVKRPKEAPAVNY